MVIESVPNVSEGARLDVVDAIAAAIRSTAGAALLDYSADAAHNRSVFTLAGEPGAVAEAVVALFRRALPAIDMRLHRGVHPRLGAVDVVPFIPLEGATLADCVVVAREVGARVAAEFDLPVYLYEDAASRPERRNLEDVRRGQFEGLAAKIARPEWVPDFGPAHGHPSAGATIVGARNALIAFNVNLATDRLDIAARIAAAVRQSSGGLPFVKAMGVRLAGRGIVQVSMNLVNYPVTPIQEAFAAVKAEADGHGVAVIESELIGLIPAAALAGTTPEALMLRDFRSNQVLENRLASLRE
jgi:glutamate formiminotransferase